MINPMPIHLARQLFAEEEEHPNRRKHRTDIIECVRLRHSYLAQRKTEEDKRRDGRKNVRYDHAPQRSQG